MSIYQNETILSLFTPLFEDGKQFIDSCLLIDVDTFYQNVTEAQADQKQLLAIYQQYFLPPSEVYIPSHPHLQYADTAIPGQFEDWSRFLFQVYGTLLKHPSRNARCVQDSLIATKYPYIVPGGRFQEAYYWDSYWLIKGVLDKEVRHGLLKNFCGFIRQFGFVPNGNRQYYLNRSQPPLLTMMVEDELGRLTEEERVSFLEEMLPCLDQEYQWWMTQKSIRGLNQFRVNTSHPRPESYKQDHYQFTHLQNNRTATDLYSSLATAAESGWDFSSRWFNSKYGGGFDSLDPLPLIQVDLNAIMYRNEVLLAQFHLECSNCSQSGNSSFYEPASLQRKQLIKQYLWNSEESGWMDYDTDLEGFRQRPSQFYLSTVFPLWLGAYDDENVEQLLINMEQAGFFSYIAGVPISLYISQQQWDSPNAWPPLQWILTEALMKLPGDLFDKYSKRLVPSLIQSWIDTNYCGWYMAERNDTVLNGMYEKYDVTEIGKPGHAGEYQVQSGFGWTNGVVLDYIRRFSVYDSSSSLPDWFQQDDSLDRLQWSGLKLPDPSICGQTIGIRQTQSPNAYQSLGIGLLLLASVIAAIGYFVKRRPVYKPIPDQMQLRNFQP